MNQNNIITMNIKNEHCTKKLISNKISSYFMKKILLALLFLCSVFLSLPSISQNQPCQQSEFSVSGKTRVYAMDTVKVYDQNEVTSAICNLSDAELGLFFKKNSKYPEDISIKGVLYVDLIIEKDGSVSNGIIVKSLHPVLDKETIRVLKLMPKFTPGKLDGKAVRSKFRMPVFFASKQ